MYFCIINSFYAYFMYIIHHFAHIFTLERAECIFKRYIFIENNKLGVFPEPVYIGELSELSSAAAE